MSRVYFHSPSEDVELWGGERAHCDILTRDISQGLLGHKPDSYIYKRWREAGILTPEYVRDDAVDGAERVFRDFSYIYGGKPIFHWQGFPLESWGLQLNTALAVGSDAVKFAARLHGQCEVHGWVDGPDRTWLADIIDGGIADGVFRRTIRHRGFGNEDTWTTTPIGWERVTTLLRGRADEPVVMSYSVCEQFPNSGSYGYDTADGRDGDGFYDIPDADQWARSMERLREHEPRVKLQLKPEGWARYRVGHNVSLIDLLHSDAEERIPRIIGDGSPAPAEVAS